MKQYLRLLSNILHDGLEHRPEDERTGTGTISLFGGPQEQMSFNLQEGFPLLTTKKLPFRWIAEELFWILRGSTDEHELQAKGVNIWAEWATAEQCAKFGREEGDLGPVYGFLWRHFGGDYDYIRRYGLDDLDWGSDQALLAGVDQLARLMHDLEHNPGSRRHIISGWDARVADQVALPPCHTLVQFKVEKWPVIGTTLSCELYMRSCDAFLGLPFNIASYALLTHLIAAVFGWSVGRLIHSFGDVHLYLNHIEQVHEQLGRQPYEPPGLLIDSVEGRTPLDKLLNYRYEHLNLRGYASWPKISAPVAV